MYRDPALLRIEFPELFDGAYLILRNPALVSWGETRSKWGHLNGNGSDDQELGTAYVASLIQEWNLPAVDDPDAGPLPLPATSESLDRLPTVVVLRLAEVGSESPNGQTPSSTSSKPRSRGTSRSKTSTTSSGH